MHSHPRLNELRKEAEIEVYQEEAATIRTKI